MVCLLTVCFDDSFLPVAEVGQVCEADDVCYWQLKITNELTMKQIIDYLFMKNKYVFCI